MKKGEQFAEGEKKCGILDTFGNIMCVNKEEECPINLVVINIAERGRKGRSGHAIWKDWSYGRGKVVHLDFDSNDGREALKEKNEG